MVGRMEWGVHYGLATGAGLMRKFGAMHQAHGAVGLGGGLLVPAKVGGVPEGQFSEEGGQLYCRKGTHPSGHSSCRLGP